MDEALMKQQAEIYKVAGVDDEAPALDSVKKRKAEQEDVSTWWHQCSNIQKIALITALQSESNKKSKASASGAAESKPKVERRSTAVFVSGLPSDVDVEEVRTCFQKYGIIAESPDDNEKRVKLYNDKNGNFKGEALIIYFRPESVAMAINMQDGYEFPRDPDLPSGVIAVAEADHSYKRHKDDTVAEDRNTSYKGKPSKVKTKKKAEEMNSRLADWSDDDISTMKQTSSRADKVVILKNVFTLQELAEDEEIREDIMLDMREEAEKHGDVKNITMFDQEEDGIVTIRFSNAMAARACADAFDGRGYSKRPLVATISTGEEKFKKSFKKDTDKEAEEAKRLEEYSKYIEGQEGPSNAEVKS